MNFVSNASLSRLLQLLFLLLLVLPMVGWAIDVTLSKSSASLSVPGLGDTLDAERKRERVGMKRLSPIKATTLSPLPRNSSPELST